MSAQFDDVPVDLDQLSSEFRSVLESLQEGIVLADSEGFIRVINGRFADITGFAREEILGKRVYEVFYPPGSAERHSEAARMEQRYAARKQGIAETYETCIVRKDGQRRWVETKAAPLLNREGAIVGSIGANSDITEKKHLEEQLRWSQKMEAVGRLAGGVAHDFNNLLTVIQGYAALIRQQMSPDDPNSRKIDVIQEASEAASAITQQLVNISRRQVVQMRPVSLNSVVEESLRVVQGLVGERVKMVVDLSPNLPLIRGDGSQVQQILLNLVVNARDAMPDGGNLLLESLLVDVDGVEVSPKEISPKGKFVRLRVEDTGHGMDEATKARVFEPFFTTKREGQGSGLGLSVTYGIVEEHGGEIRVASEPGQGATFDVFFPATDLLESETKSSHDWRVLTGTEVVLLAEDHPAVRVLVKETLQRFGYQVIDANDGQEAFEIAAGTAYPTIDLLISDLVMPRLDGLSLAKKIQSIRPNIKILLLSGYADESFSGNRSEEHPYNFLGKPFSPENLLRRVRSLLESETLANRV